MSNIQELAKKAASYFTTQTRNNGKTIVLTKDDCPKWVTEMCREAHGDMMPDDWKFEFIKEALDRFQEYDDPDDCMSEIEPDIYTSDLLAWLGSRNDRTAYCDEVYDECETIVDAMMLGQVYEKREVYELVRSYLENNPGIADG